MPVPKRVWNIKALARVHTEMALKTICGLAENANSEAVKLQACALLLERGWGRAMPDDDGEGNSITITIRNVLREKQLVIEHEPSDEKV